MLYLADMMCRLELKTDYARLTLTQASGSNQRKMGPRHFAGRESYARQQLLT